MTIASENTAMVQLTEYDQVLGGSDSDSFEEFDLPWAISTDVHLYPNTPVTVRMYKKYVMIRFGVYAADVAIHAKAEQLDRLINVLTAARQRLRK